MRFEITHRTRYDYEDPVSYLIQLLRLTPRSGIGQNVVSWRVSAPARLLSQVDAFSNLTHIMTITQPIQYLEIMVQGVVEIADDVTSHRFEHDGLSPMVYTLASRYTQADAALTDLACDNLNNGRASEKDFFRLMQIISERVAYVAGSTDVSTSAIESFAQGKGVCQDHAHVFIACCHAVGIPARYVSGYFNTGDKAHVASHAWVDVYTPEHDWLGLDITNQCVTDGRHCRLAIGRDYDSAAPVRGSRFGGGVERLNAHVFVSAQSSSLDFGSLDSTRLDLSQ